MKKYCILFSLIFLSNLSFGQGGLSAVPFLLFQQSPIFEGAGRIGVAVPMQDAMGYYYNPAQLGYYSQNNNLSISFMPQKTNISINPIPLATFQSMSITAGYNFNRFNIPLYVGIGYLQNQINYSNGSKVPANINDSFKSISFGAGYDYFLIFNLGISYKSFISSLGNDPWKGNIKTEGACWDYGAMIVAPVSKLWLSDISYNLNRNLIFKPILNVTLGYSLTNVGKEIYYLDAAQSDPIPRTARLGYSFDFGINSYFNETELKAIEYSFTAEAEDLLINNDSLGNVKYQGFLGDISFGKNLLGLKGDNNIAVHRGHIFRFFETVILTSGRINGENYDMQTSGIGFSSEGVLILLSTLTDSPVLKFASRHIVIEYYNTNNTTDFGYNARYKGLSFIIKNFSI